LTVEQAKERYVKKIEEMKVTYGYDANKQPEAVGSS
jgi:diazepam-binding inhibitor (GABA receptor modulating acyl-CoA-binding protein)